MNHRKAKDLIPEVAKEMDLPLDLANDLVDYYWSTIRKTLVSLEHSHVRIMHLGILDIRNTFLLEKEILSTTKRLPYNEAYIDDLPPGRDITPVTYKLKQKIARLKALKLNYLEELHDKEINKKLRKEIYESKQNMAKQEADPGGFNQLNPDQSGSRTDSPLAEQHLSDL